MNYGISTPPHWLADYSQLLYPQYYPKTDSPTQDGAVSLNSPKASLSPSSTQVLISKPTERSRTNPVLQEYVATVPRAQFGEPVVEQLIIPLPLSASGSHSMAVCVNITVQDTSTHTILYVTVSALSSKVSQCISANWGRQISIQLQGSNYSQENAKILSGEKNKVLWNLSPQRRSDMSGLTFAAITSGTNKKFS